MGSGTADGESAVEDEDEHEEEPVELGEVVTLGVLELLRLPLLVPVPVPVPLPPLMPEDGDAMIPSGLVELLTLALRLMATLAVGVGDALAVPLVLVEDDTEIHVLEPTPLVDPTRMKPRAIERETRVPTSTISSTRAVQLSISKTTGVQASLFSHHDPPSLLSADA